jgi:hypothetical protein
MEEWDTAAGVRCPGADSRESDVLGHAGVPGWVTAGDGGLHPVTETVRPRRGRMAVIHRAAGRIRCPVTATMTALEAVTPSAGTESGSTRIVVVRTVPGERFDGPVS